MKCILKKAEEKEVALALVYVKRMPVPWWTPVPAHRTTDSMANCAGQSASFRISGIKRFDSCLLFPHPWSLSAAVVFSHCGYISASKES